METEVVKAPVDPVFFYVLARNDFDTMTQGRSDAQVSHATSDLHELMTDRRLKMTVNGPGLDLADSMRLALFQEWRRQTAEKGSGRFGTTIVLMGPMDDIYAAVQFARNAGFDAGITHDPEYWRVDGKKAFCLPEDTCGWMIGRKGDLAALLRRWPLLAAR